MSGTESTPRPRPLESAKITDTHRSKLAVVYVRQSTPQQVVENRESLDRQYALADHARALGWPAERVLVIDEDLGQSGRTADARLGFQRLLAEVSMDHVGLVLSLEMSRLSRSCRDWHHLLEVCGLFGALLADQDGLYDPSDPNDRLVLGLKGQLSEMELHIIRSRLERGKLNKARRGELLTNAPIGYVKTPAGGLALDPDEQVQRVVRLVFDKFDELGTAHAVTRYLRENHIRLGIRAHDGPNRGNLEWRPALASTVYRMLAHPAYAGTYAYGRPPIEPRRRRRNGQPGIRRAQMAEWAVTLPDRLPAYITWERFLRNTEQLRQNRTTATTKGHARQGIALLAGLVYCGHCGHRKGLLYGATSRPRYDCVTRRQPGEPRTCPGISAAALDAAVSEQVLRALTPAGIELSVAAAGDIERERARLDAHWKAELERAGYEVRLAERSYRAADPDNRLVVRTLERRWEEAPAPRSGGSRGLRPIPPRIAPEAGPGGARPHPGPGRRHPGPVERRRHPGGGPQGDRPRPHRAGDRDDPRGRRAGDGPHRVDRRDRDGARPAATDQLLQTARRLRADAAARGVRRRGRPDRGGDRRDPQSGGLPPALRPRGPLHAGAGPGPGVPAGPQPEAAARGAPAGRRMVAPRPGGRARRGIRPIQGMGQEGLCPCPTRREPEASGDLGRCR